MKVKVYLKEY